MTGVSVADMYAGLYTAIAILAALQHRARTGEGQHIDISMQDCVWDITAAQTATSYFFDGRVPQRKGNRAGGTFGVFPTRDGNVVINVVTGGQWERLATVMGRDDLVRDGIYADRRSRQENADEMGAIVEEWTRQRTTDEVVRVLTEAHLPSSPVPTYEQVASDPQLLSRDMVTEVDQVISGKVTVQGSPFKMTKTPGDPRQPAPFLGQHNQEVYGGLLGYSDEQLARLVDEGVIWHSDSALVDRQVGLGSSPAGQPPCTPTGTAPGGPFTRSPLSRQGFRFTPAPRQAVALPARIE